ncbi:hypothetical protein JAAARDRAFT_194848 [Jaapia argillacea MUCL 33604]|uniref:Phospholipase/carboxylesterase/thioesterase domain-containing protein n=1 Tax=Jaapia argillacea MUCL 33604 TaxID=933084 RepID=A0A067PQ33_9AGAM|nr:hypothetical protein JAAARDRAFT_194848 [Jaapia argillacea MUCL 33604]
MTSPDEIEIHIESPGTLSRSNPRVKPAPRRSFIPVPFSYHPSDDGTDENLLILLHGLGDTHAPFSSLGRSLKLPQTATLSIRAPSQIPLLDDPPAYQWYPSFDHLGELVTNPNPTPALDLLVKIIEALIKECFWPHGRIHLFGFGQGGTVCAESALRWWTKCRNTAPTVADPLGPLASVVTICGPLISYPTLPITHLCPTPVLFFRRASSAGGLAALNKGFRSVTEVPMPGDGEMMPRNRQEWEPIMRFWSERLSRRSFSEEEGIYEVLTGQTNA